MSDNLFTIEETRRHNVVSIKVIGVGGGGSNMVNHMIREGLKGVDMIAANTDAQHLATSLAPVKIQLGEKLTRGLGAGMKPEVGKQAAEESYDQIKEALKGADLIFIAAGLGGGTGTGAASVVAQAAKENGALTIGVCTQPFNFEAPKRSRLAQEGLEALKRECDSMVIIPNEKLFSIVDRNMGYAESFALVDNVLARAVRGMSSIVLPNGLPGMNTDFNDLKTVMGHKGKALMGMGVCAEGSDSAYDALKDAIESPLLDNLSINGAMGVLVHYQIHPSYPIVALNRAMQTVYDAVTAESDVIFGTSLDDTLKPEEVRVTIIATGFMSEADINTSLPQQPKPNIANVGGGYGVVGVNEKGEFYIQPNETEIDIPTAFRNRAARRVVGGF
ncbi:MAG: cell division protein FtsZ, partial [Helicobacteraceae bacterium]|nr:cell division protein FtsZ [Helicobacteraceae bacterium]